jgi:hypothetical protein
VSSIKDALLKVGLKSSKNENDRQKRKNWVEVKKSVIHQEQRNYCEACESIQPDVERYKHRNPIVDAQWICVSCADKNMIDDKFRVTSQSDFSIKKIFRREFGQTNKEVGLKKASSNKDVDGNRKLNTRSKFHNKENSNPSGAGRRKSFKKTSSSGNKKY